MKAIISKLNFLLFLFTYLITFQSCSNDNEKYTIGALAPLTGEGANYGRVVKEGIDLAVDEINTENFLDKPLEIIIEDDKMSPRDGVNVINKLIGIDKVPVIIGPFGSSIVLAVSPVAEKNKVVVISASATADNIKDAGDYIFRITPPNSKQGSDIAEFCVNKLNSKTGAIIYQVNDYGETLREAFQKKFTELGGKILSSQGIVLNTSDLRTQLQSIKKQKPDVVFFPLHYKESGMMLKQAKELGINSNFISADGAMTEDLLKIAGNAAEGTFYSTLALGFGISDDAIKEFELKFQKKYNKEPNVYSAYYYEVIKLIAYVIKNVGMDSGKIRDFLYSIKDDNAYKGITGTTSFDKHGEVNKPFYIYQVEDAKYVLFEK